MLDSSAEVVLPVGLEGDPRFNDLGCAACADELALLVLSESRPRACSSRRRASSGPVSVRRLASIDRRTLSLDAHEPCALLRCLWRVKSRRYLGGRSRRYRSRRRSASTSRSRAGRTLYRGSDTRTSPCRSRPPNHGRLRLCHQRGCLPGRHRRTGSLAACAAVASTDVHSVPEFGLVGLTRFSEAV
jgi:hypothetical protein